MLVEMIDRWTGDPQLEKFPLEHVMAEVMRVGKHFLDPDLLAALDRARSALPAATGPADRRGLVCRVVDVLLDKFDQRYDYLTYTAMSLFPIVDETDQERVRDRTVALLVADLVTFELGALDGTPQPMPDQRPDRDTVEKRCRLALRAARPAAVRVGVVEGAETADAGGPAEAAGSADAGGPAEAGGSAIDVARDMAAEILWHAYDAERELLRLSMHPVATIHDEHMFLRVLQAFEATFVLLAARLRRAIAAVHDEDLDAAADILRGNGAVLHEAGLLFSLLATMQVDSFRTFRAFTEGASAIQSEGYKTVESLCRRPSAERLSALPYESVPKVQARVYAGQPTIQDAVDALGHEPGDGSGEGPSPAERANLAAAMQEFEEAMVRWRRTHHRVAVRMLGNAPGSGYSEGTPYLESVIEIPVFGPTAP